MEFAGRCKYKKSKYVVSNSSQLLYQNGKTKISPKNYSVFKLSFYSNPFTEIILLMKVRQKTSLKPCTYFSCQGKFGNFIFFFPPNKRELGYKFLSENTDRIDKHPGYTRLVQQRCCSVCETVISGWPNNISSQGQTSDRLAIYIFAYLPTLFHQKTASRKKRKTINR